jgi:general secretion pathway protein G
MHTHHHNDRNHHRRRARAFTILEVMIVLVIIGLIGAIVTVNLVGVSDQARAQQTEASMKTIAQALKMYRGTHGSYPIGTGVGSLDVLVVENLLEESPVDGWNRPFEYYSAGVQYEIRSLGSDLESDADDIIEVTKHQ